MKHLFSYTSAILLLCTPLSASAFDGMMFKMVEKSNAKVSCTSACNKQYAQCLAGSSDFSLTNSAADIMPRTKSNLAATSECTAAGLQCNRACY